MTKFPHVPFSHNHWMTRVRKSILIASLIVSGSLTFGILGYHIFGHLSWIDSLLEASMILGGMGPVTTLQSNAVKIFASFYALYSGLILVSTTGLLLAPWLQRLLYHTHRQAQNDAQIEEIQD